TCGWGGLGGAGTGLISASTGVGEAGAPGAGGSAAGTDKRAAYIYAPTSDAASRPTAFCGYAEEEADKPRPETCPEVIHASARTPTAPSRASARGSASSAITPTW